MARPAFSNPRERPGSDIEDPDNGSRGGNEGTKFGLQLEVGIGPFPILVHVPVAFRIGERPRPKIIFIHQPRLPIHTLNIAALAFPVNTLLLPAATEFSKKSAYHVNQNVR